MVSRLNNLFYSVTKITDNKKELGPIPHPSEMPLYQKWIPGEVRHGGCYSWKALYKAPACS